MIKANNYPDRTMDSRRPPRIDYVEYDIDPIAGESEIDSKARASLKTNLVVK